MAGRADIQTHLANRRDALAATFATWAQPTLTASERAAIVESYFHEANIGSPQRVGTASVLVKARRTDVRLPTVLVLGRHQVADLAPRRVEHTGDFTGPGLARRLGATLAFCEGMQAARAVTTEEPLNITYLSVGDGDTYDTALSHVFTGNLDAVFFTDALHWAADQPVVTAGCRGQVRAEITLTAGSDIADYDVSGALRNPLTKMMQLLGSLRDERGRIVLSDFYSRANRPDPAVVDLLGSAGIDGNSWTRPVSISAFGGSRTSLERAAMWPGVSVLAIETSVADGVSAPGVVRATIGIYLVPDQRHAEVERSLRAWLDSSAPADLHPQLRVLQSARPFRADPNGLPVAAQGRAAARLFRSDPLLIPAGGASGSGELAYRFDVPVAYAGLAAPSESIGTTAEHLRWKDFDSCVERATETALEMRRT